MRNGERERGEEEWGKINKNIFMICDTEYYIVMYTMMHHTVWPGLAMVHIFTSSFISVPTMNTHNNRITRITFRTQIISNNEKSNRLNCILHCCANTVCHTHTHTHRHRALVTCTRKYSVRLWLLLVSELYFVCEIEHAPSEWIDMMAQCLMSKLRSNGMFDLRNGILISIREMRTQYMALWELMKIETISRK